MGDTVLGPKTHEGQPPCSLSISVTGGCWLAEEQDAKRILNQMVLKQFMAWLSTGTVQWVQSHQPASLGEAIQLAEDHLAVFIAADGSLFSFFHFCPLGSSSS